MSTATLSPNQPLDGASTSLPPSTKNMMTSEEICKGLESLPNELCDEIYKQVFSIEPGDRDLQDLETVRYHLNLMQVSHATRAEYATKYYGSGSIFNIETNNPEHLPVIDRSTLHNWLRSLSLDHRKLVKRCRYVWAAGADESKLFCMKPLRDMSVSGLYGIRLRYEVTSNMTRLSARMGNSVQMSIIHLTFRSRTVKIDCRRTSTLRDILEQ